MNKKDTVSFADIETTEFSDDFSIERIEQIEFKLGCIITYDLNRNELERVSYTDLSEFCSKLNRLNIVYFHNLSFDFKFIQKELLSLNSQFRIINTPSSTLCVKFYKLKTKKLGQTVELRDSLAVLKSSIKRLGLAIGKPKLEVENNNYVNLKYCFRDCEIIAYSFFSMIDFIKKQFDYDIKLTRIPLTIASLSKKVFQTIYPNAFYRHDHKIHEKARKYYYGGRTEVFDYNLLEHGFYVDVVSLYPSIATNEKLPNSFTFWFDTVIPNIETLRATNHVFGFECEITENQFIPLYPTRKDDKVVFMNGKKKIFMTIQEYDYLKENNIIGKEIIIKNVSAVVMCKDLSQFDKFFIPLANTKLETNYESEKWFCKLFMNSLTGKFGQKPERKEIIYYNDMEISKNKDFYYDIDLDCSYTEKTSLQYFQTTNLLTVICITNLARFTLWKKIKELHDKGCKVYYCDTDSVVVDNKALNNFELSNNLGNWSIETEVFNFQALDSKEYIFTDNNDNLRIKFKGLITEHFKRSDFYSHYVKGSITRLIPKNRYCDIRQIPHNSVIFLSKEKRQFYFKRLVDKDLTTLPLKSKNLLISAVKKNNRNIIYSNIIEPHLIVDST